MAKICDNKIFENIISTCETGQSLSAGIEQKIYLANRTDLVYTTGTGENFNNNEVPFLSLKEGAKMYYAAGLKKNLTAGFERVLSDTAPDTWQNSLTLVGYQFDMVSAENMDTMGDLVAIIERKTSKKNTDGTFLVLGLENGLYVSEDSWSANDNGGSRQLTLQSLDDAGESFSAYVLTLAATPKPGTTQEEQEFISTPEEIREYLDSLCE